LRTVLARMSQDDQKILKTNRELGSGTDLAQPSRMRHTCLGNILSQ
jgi:hypothetical protein